MQQHSVDTKQLVPVRQTFDLCSALLCWAGSQVILRIVERTRTQAASKQERAALKTLCMMSLFNIAVSSQVTFKHGKVFIFKDNKQKKKC